LPHEPPFVLPEDKDKVLAFNTEECESGRPHLLNLDIIPAPFVGNPNAPVVLLGNIAGFLEREPEDYRVTPAHAARMRQNLLHAPAPPLFYPFDSSPDVYPTHKHWWTEKLRYLLHSFGNGSAAEAILARAIFAVEYFPYRSCSGRYAHDRLTLSSQEYSRKLVQNAMKNGSVIVVRYGKHRWFAAVPELEAYPHCLLLKGRQRTYISPDGFVDEHGYQQVVDKINEYLPSRQAAIS
jgi:hypothetical protein